MKVLHRVYFIPAFGWVGEYIRPGFKIGKKVVGNSEETLKLFDELLYTTPDLKLSEKQAEQLRKTVDSQNEWIAF